MALTENSIRALLARAKTEEAKEGIQFADELSDMILFHTRIKENGEQELCGLGKAGVGAIYLGSSESEFALKDSGNTTNAMIRQTGIFLYENGNTGTIQQLDLAT